MRTITTTPPNTGVDMKTLNGKTLSQEQMYLRCNFEVPASPPPGFDVVVPGSGRRFITPAELQSFERLELDIVLECAGNGRTLMSPVPDGTPWDLDGVSPITVAGYRLADVLGGLPDECVDVVFTGADTGTVDPEGRVPYQFSISREMALSPRPLLVTHIGGEPLQLAHGAPVRLVVAGQYAMESVKWLVRVEAVASPFEGHFVKKYRYYGDQNEPEQGRVGDLAVRSVIAMPGDGETIAAGAVTITGSAWSGSSPIAGVAVSIDGGESWIVADLDLRPDEPWSAVPWEVTVDAAPGPLVIAARAMDTAGSTQPHEPRWNANGYANNVVHRVTVTVE
jgi:DMSO/TMAO reductase YedYZ molybdopterin-dependent catalytic subunit